MYHTAMMHLIRLFSVILMLSCTLFVGLYCASFFTNKVGYYPWWSIAILTILMAAGAAMWKLSSAQLAKAPHTNSNSRRKT